MTTASYEDLFGIPTELAVLEDYIFEHPDKATTTGHSGRLSLHSRRARGRKPGPRHIANWLLKLTGDGASPLYDERAPARTSRPPATCSTRWIETGEHASGHHPRPSS